MILPLSSQIVNWKMFIKNIQDLTGESPTRCLDKYSLDLNNPYSLLVCLQSLRTPNFDPWKDKLDDDILQHMTMTFAADTRFDVAEEIHTTCTYLNISHIILNRASCFLIMTGTLLDWKYVLPCALSCKTSKESVERLRNN